MNYITTTNELVRVAGGLTDNMSLFEWVAAPFGVAPPMFTTWSPLAPFIAASLYITWSHNLGFKMVMVPKPSLEYSGVAANRLCRGVS